MNLVRTVIVMVILALLPTSGSSQAARLSRRIEYHNASWSPDGRTLLFESTLNGKYSIYTINIDGSGLRHVTADTSENSQASWSADGKRIVFSSDRGGSGMQVHVMNSDGTVITQLTHLQGGGYYQSSFSPDGNWIVFQGRADNRETRDRVYVMRSDGSALRLLSDSTSGAEGPAWSPDGKSITFNQVPYPKRYWNEMTPPDLAAAKSAARVMSVRIDGSGLAPADGTARRVADAAIVPGANPSPDGRSLVYTKTADGWYGLYVYDIATKRERLVIGGPGAGPLGYLRTTTLTARSDTFETYTSPRDGAIVPGNGAYYIRATRQIGARRFELSNTWFDSAGQITAKQTVRTAPNSLATDLETVRATTDSASLLVTADRVTAWVVRPGEAARLYDAPTTGERYAGDVVSMAIVRSQPAIGNLYVAPMHALFGPNPVDVCVDSIRVVRRDSVFDGQTVRRVFVLERSNGQVWVEEQSGAILLSRGNAGPNRWWWHIRRGVRPPD
jgi:sugar lactone lactonase YvrE